MANQINIRLLALETLLECEKKDSYIKEALDKTLFQNQFLSKQERSFLSRLTEGVTEYRIQLDYIIDQYSKTKVNKCKPVIRVILRMGVYQMIYMDSVGKETACNESVKLARKKGFHQLTGFVNGVLRSIAGNLDQINLPDEAEEPELFLSIHYSMPEWIVRKLLQWYGLSLTKQILEASLETEDLTIRVNTSKTTTEELSEQLSKAGITVSGGNYTEDALHLKNINYVRRIPGFKDGDFFVQDESSMLVGTVMKKELEDYIRIGESDEILTVLDLCSAPGGKSTHFAQMLGDKGRVIARDLTEAKVSYIRENKERLQLSNVIPEVRDALELDEDMIEAADVVIADLPCSGLGIMGKKNDIKYHLKEEQLQQLETLQRDILKNAMQYVRPGGILLYSTCTINPGENVENGKWLAGHEELEAFSIKERIPDALKSCLIEENMLQLLQGRDKCDGFFIAAFRRK